MFGFAERDMSDFVRRDIFGYAESDMFPATSMVVTLHWRDHFLSVDLTSFEISATGGRKRFALPANVRITAAYGR